jgi:general secretion pathway protein K
MAIAAEQRRWVDDVAARRDQVQAQSLALAGAPVVAADPRRDSGGGVDSLGQPWALPLPATPLENGFIEGRIVDAQGLLNVNNATLTGTQGDEERARLARLFARQGVPAAALDALADWIDTDRQARGNGAEDAFYARAAAPYLAANAPLVRVGELGAVRYFDDAALARALPYLTALPAGTPLNVNTAPLAVLAAALPAVAPEALARLAASASSGRSPTSRTSATDCPRRADLRRARLRRVEQLLHRHRARAPGRHGGAGARAAQAHAGRVAGGDMADARIAARAHATVTLRRPAASRRP